MAKTALITGASSGLGRVFARLFAADGHDVVLVSRGEQRLRELADELIERHGIQARVLPADLSQAESPQCIFDELQQDQVTVDFLVNNAGFGNFGKFHGNDWEAERSLLHVNIVSPVHLAHLFLSPMVQRGEGRVLNVASTAAMQPGPYMANYFASKAYLLSWSHALSLELKRTGVTVTALCPGPTETEFFIRAGANPGALNSMMMSDDKVARIGYDAMMAGKTRVIAGWSNKLGALAAQLVPRGLAASGAARFNKRLKNSTSIEA